MAKLLDVAPSRVRQLATPGNPGLYSYRSQSGDRRFPTWQFNDGNVIPHLRCCPESVNHSKGARAGWQNWIQMALVTEIRALISMANQLEIKLFGILNAMRFRASNGLAEAIVSGQLK